MLYRAKWEWERRGKIESVKRTPENLLKLAGGWFFSIVIEFFHLISNSESRLISSLDSFDPLLFFFRGFWYLFRNGRWRLCVCSFDCFGNFVVSRNWIFGFNRFVGEFNSYFWCWLIDFFSFFFWIFVGVFVECVGWFLIMMCTSVSNSVVLGINALSTDVEIVLFLGGRRVGDPIPATVITEVNPFSIEPWNSPGWYQSIW